MVIVVTNRGDLAADWLILFISVATLPRAFQYRRQSRFRGPALDTSGDAFLRLPGEHVNLAKVTSVWFRRPVDPRAPDGADEALAAWAVRESQETLDGGWRTLRARWVPNRTPVPGPTSASHPDSRAGSVRRLTDPARVDAEKPGEAFEMSIVVEDSQS